MRIYDDDDDSLEAEKYRAYAVFCPEGVDLEIFVNASERIINDFKNTDNPLIAKEINRQLSALQKSIKDLYPETRAVLRAREHDHWQEARSQGNVYDDEWLQRAEHVSRVGAALDVLKETSAGKFTRKRWTAVKRTALIARAIFLFKCGTEKIEVRNGKLVKYIGWLLDEVGLEDSHAKKALRDFLKEHAIELTESNFPQKVYKIKPRTS
jgi:hypothetical protein